MGFVVSVHVTMPGVEIDQFVNLRDALAAMEHTRTCEELLQQAFSFWGERLVLCTAFQAEGMALLDMCVAIFPRVRVVTIDTGRLPEETHAFMKEVQKHYGIAIEVCAPDARELSRLIAQRGPNAFYFSTLDRRLCCHIRKVRPLDAYLAAESGNAVAAWISGLRREHSASRAGVQRIATDELHPQYDAAWRGHDPAKAGGPPSASGGSIGARPQRPTGVPSERCWLDGVGATGASQKKAAGPLYKLAPLADWSDADVENYTRAHNVPRHPLYAQSYRSIGCAPCTRAVAAGEDARAGRWWWETDVEKECGLHIRADGRVVPAFDVALEKIITAGQPPSRGEQFGMSP